MEWVVDDPVIERVQLDDRSWIDVVRVMIPDAAEVHAELRDTLAWEQGSVFRYEKHVEMPRLGARAAGRDAHPALAELGTWLDRHYRVLFDQGALAQYRDGSDSVGFHRDREMRWLEETLIAVMTFGATRPFLVRPLTGQRAAADDLRGVLDFAPAGGDLLVMGGRTQASWLHAVPKVPARVGTRISVQYRWTSKRGRPDTNPSFYAPRHFGSR